MTGTPFSIAFRFAVGDSVGGVLVQTGIAPAHPVGKFIVNPVVARIDLRCRDKWRQVQVLVTASALIDFGQAFLMPVAMPTTIHGC